MVPTANKPTMGCLIELQRKEEQKYNLDTFWSVAHRDRACTFPPARRCIRFDARLFPNSKRSTSEPLLLIEQNTTHLRAVKNRLKKGSGIDGRKYFLG